MSAPIIDRDLTKQAPHSPRERIGGFVIAKRTVDKCRASVAGSWANIITIVRWTTCFSASRALAVSNSRRRLKPRKPMKRLEPGFKLTAKKKTPAEIKAWSDKVEADSVFNDPKKRAYFIENCAKLGLKPEKSTTFDWLEADDRASFKSVPA